MKPLIRELAAEYAGRLAVTTLDSEQNAPSALRANSLAPVSVIP